jgi:hypothetical protein
MLVRSVIRFRAEIAAGNVIFLVISMNVGVIFPPLRWRPEGGRPLPNPVPYREEMR